MRIHFIAIGGAIMHALAISLHNSGHDVSGSDDEIYDPSRSKLKAHGLLSEKMGWSADRITPDLDMVILGMHARANNPELLRALEIGVEVMSFPEFIASMSKEKTRVVIAGSHGKTTTTSMIMHVLNFHDHNYDYLVGAHLEGFDNMVRLTDAPLIIVEGDEYLSSPIDRRPKIFHYDPDITVITGIAWDHINVFPTNENYVDQFKIYIEDMKRGTRLFYYQYDKQLCELVSGYGSQTDSKAYSAHPTIMEEGNLFLISNAEKIPIDFFGQHNLENVEAARLVCNQLKITDEQFYEAIGSFRGASKRLQFHFESDKFKLIRDFAHAPSKVRASVNAVKSRFPEHHLTACFELHTYSSLNKKFLPEYKDALEDADTAVVFFSPHTLEMKKLPMIGKQDVVIAFGRQDLQVIQEKDQLERFLHGLDNKEKKVILLMSSGTFDHFDLESLKKL